MDALNPAAVLSLQAILGPKTRSVYTRLILLPSCHYTIQCVPSESRRCPVITEGQELAYPLNWRSVCTPSIPPLSCNYTIQCVPPQFRLRPVITVVGYSWSTLFQQFSVYPFNFAAVLSLHGSVRIPRIPPPSCHYTVYRRQYSYVFW